MSHKKLLLSLSCICIWISALSGQSQENAPYSRFGLGDFTVPYLAAQGQMGGWSAAYQDPYFINYLNPASLSYLQATALEVGVYGSHTWLKNDLGGSTRQRGGNLSYISLAFPIKNPLNDMLSRRTRKFFWGAGLTLVPFTRVSYNVSTTEFAEGLGRIRRQYNGSGGTYKILLGNGFRYGDISAGFNVGLLFGKLRQDRLILLEDYTNYYLDNLNDDQVVNSFVWNAGAQYNIWLRRPKEEETRKVRRYLTVGAYGNSGGNYVSEVSRLYIGYNTLTQLSDTLFNERDSRERGVMPSSFTFGLAYNDENRFRIGADYSFTDWSSFTNPVNRQALGDAWSFQGGVEYIPNFYSISKFMERVRYRAGVRFGQDPRVFDGPIRTMEFNLGVGLPFVVSREVSFLHLGVSFGRIYGNIPISEQYIRATMSFTFVDNTWFLKRRFY